MTEWMAFSSLEPFGTDTQYIGPAITSTILANANRPKGDKAHTVDEFMPKFEKETKTPDQMLNFVSMLNAGLGGQDLRQQEDEP